MTNRRIASLTLTAAMLSPWLSASATDEKPKPVAAQTVMKTSTSWDGKPIIYPSGASEISVLSIEIASGQETGWHSHPVPSFAYVLAGTLEVTEATGKSKIVRTGEMLAEVVNTSHNGRAIGGAPVKLIVLYAGAAGHALSEVRGAPTAPTDAAPLPPAAKN